MPRQKGIFLCNKGGWQLGEMDGFCRRRFHLQIHEKPTSFSDILVGSILQIRKNFTHQSFPFHHMPLLELMPHPPEPGDLSKAFKEVTQMLPSECRRTQDSNWNG